MTQYGFFFDQSRCYGCKACSVAGKDWYDIAPGPEKWMSVYMWEKGRFPNPSIGILTFNCGHCDNPVCAAACENGAIFKEDKYGAVLIDQDKCKGDRHCFEACPYGAPKFASDKPGTKMSKCTAWKTTSCRSAWHRVPCAPSTSARSTSCARSTAT